jgi:DNA repair exonuclease SbcCD nuclease subunit
MQWKDFVASLIETKANVHVCMGDIFDSFVVPYSLILRVANTYETTARVNKATEFVLIRGNHDADRDLERRSAFDILEALLKSVKNVHVVSEYPLSLGGLCFFPWHPTKTTVDMLPGPYNGTDLKPGPELVAFGHWDVEDFGNNNPNLIPAQALKDAGFVRAYTGHDHKPREIKIDGLPITVVGSMQPYAHGEETDDSLYVTKTLHEVIKDTAACKDKCLRVLLNPGEVFDIEVDYLQLTIKRLVDNESEEGDELDVEVGAFDIEALLTKAFAEEGVEDDVALLVRQNITDRRIVE